MSESLPPDVDPRLWFSCDLEPTARDYLVGNAHTFTGRMLAYCERKEGSPRYYVSATSVWRDCSDEARYWVAGFLAGAEPQPPRDEDGDWLPPDHADFVAWRAKADAFTDTGQWQD